MFDTKFPDRVTKQQVTTALGYTPADQEDVLLKGEVDGRNRFIMSTAVAGTVGSGGNFSSSQRYFRSDYIDVSDTNTITGQVWGAPKDLFNGFGLYIIIQFFDKEKTAIIGSGTGGRSENGVEDTATTYFKLTASVPNNAKYCIFVASLNPNSVENAHAKLEFGDVGTDWTPAPEDVVVRSELESEVRVIEGEYVDIAVEKYGHVCSAHTSMDKTNGSIKTRKAIQANDWIKLCALGQKPYYDIFFPIGFYPYNTYVANARITSDNGSLYIWTEKEIPIDVELYINATFICQ